MTQWSESLLSESPALRRLIALGWTHIPGSTIDQERDSLAHATLPQRLLNAIKRLNPWISMDNAVFVYRHQTLGDVDGHLEEISQGEGILCQPFR
jgi:type I restriction enzyme R subunit